MSIPINFPYPRSSNVEAFDFYGSVNVNAATNNATVITFTVSNQVRGGYLTLFGHDIDDVTAWALSTWRILVNGVIQKYYGQIQDQLALFTDPKEIAPIKIRSGDIVSVAVDNGTVGAHLYGARLRGFFDYGQS